MFVVEGINTAGIDPFKFFGGKLKGLILLSEGHFFWTLLKKNSLFLAIIYPSIDTYSCVFERFIYEANMRYDISDA